MLHLNRNIRPSTMRPAVAVAGALGAWGGLAALAGVIIAAGAPRPMRMHFLTTFSARPKP